MKDSQIMKVFYDKFCSSLTLGVTNFIWFGGNDCSTNGFNNLIVFDYM